MAQLGLTSDQMAIRNLSMYGDMAETAVKTGLIEEKSTVFMGLINSQEVWAAYVGAEQVEQLIKMFPKLMLNDEVALLFAKYVNVKAIDTLKFYGWKVSEHFKLSLMQTLRNEMINADDWALRISFEKIQRLTQMGLL